MVFVSKKIVIEEDSDNKKSESSKYTLANCVTYYDEVILTLEVLEKEQGINLYDGSTFPGMNLKNVQNPEKIKRIFESKKSKNTENAEQINTSNENNIPNNLLNFFKNGKKE